MPDATRPWIVVGHKGGRKVVYRFASKAEADAKRRRLQHEGHSPIMVFRASKGY